MEVLRRSFDPFECGSKCSHWVFNYTCSLGTVLGIFIIGTITKEPLRKSSCMSYLEQMLFNKCNLSHANPLSLESFRGIHFIYLTWSRACERSAHMSSTFSTPMLNRIRFSLMPISARLAGPKLQYDCTAGISIRLSTPPRDGAMYGILTLSMNLAAAQRSPLTSKLTTPPNPDICQRGFKRSSVICWIYETKHRCHGSNLSTYNFCLVENEQRKATTGKGFIVGEPQSTSLNRWKQVITCFLAMAWSGWLSSPGYQTRSILGCFSSRWIRKDWMALNQGK